LQFGFDLGGIGGERPIDRIVADDLSAADYEGGTGKHAPCADRTLEQSPTHVPKVIRGPSRPVKETRANR
jgi:hypothetical protein